MKTEVRYGVIFAVIVIVYVMIEHFLGLNTVRHDIGEYTRLAGIIVPIIGVFAGIGSKRNELGGNMTFGQGFKAGLIVAVVQTTITTLWFWFYSSVVNPQYLPTMLDFERARMVASGASSADIDARLASVTSMYSSPRMQIFLELVGIAHGAVSAAISAALLRKKKSTSPVTA
jgi:hypothetical protein